MDSSTPGLPILHQFPELTHVIESVTPSRHLILCRPLLLLSSIFPSISNFPNESVLRIKWPKYWSFSFNISHSNEYSGLISFRLTSLISLQSKGQGHGQGRYKYVKEDPEEPCGVGLKLELSVRDML